MKGTLADRSLQTRQLDSILDWLREPDWTPWQAACLLVGVLPPEQAFGCDDRRFGAWLPGQEPWEHHRDIWEKKVTAEIEQMERKLVTIPNIGIMSPAELLGHLLRQRRKRLPPWAAAILDSKAHAKALSPEVRSKMRDALGRAEETEPRANSGYAAKLKNDPNWDSQVFEAELRWKDGQSNEVIANALADRYPAKTAGAISVWTRKFKRKISAEAQTVGFREYRDRVNR